MGRTIVKRHQVADLTEAFMKARRGWSGGMQMNADDTSGDDAGSDSTSGDDPNNSDPQGSTDNPTPNGSQGSTPAHSEDYAKLAEIAKELNLEPGQIAGRLEASKKWEQRAKKDHKAGNNEPPPSPDEIREQILAEVRAENEITAADAVVRGRLIGAGMKTEDIETVMTTLTHGLRGIVTDGRVDAAKVDTLMGIIAHSPQTWPDMGQGNRGNPAGETGLSAGRSAYQERHGKK